MSGLITPATGGFDRRSFLRLTGSVGAGAALVTATATEASAAEIPWSNPCLGRLQADYAGHLGRDVAAAHRTPVYAAADGVVDAYYNGSCYQGHDTAHVIRYRSGRGIHLRHADGRYTFYGHLEVAAVWLGQRVSRGQFLGTVGLTGNTSGYHLHWEVHWNVEPSGEIAHREFLAARGVTLGSSTPVGSTGYTAVQQGSSGNTVRVLQRLLAGEGRSIAIDGVFGSTTASHVKAVQTKKGLYADGVVGNWSWAAFITRLASGSTGHKVGALQQALNNHGAGLVIDGDFGSVTLSAVKSFQSSKGLVADGIVGPVTWVALI